MSGTVNVGVIEAILRLRDEFTPILARVATEMKDKGAQMQQLGRALLPISAAFAAVGVAGVMMATDLNRSMANVASLIPNSTARVLELKAAVQEMAVETGKSTADLSDGLYQVISSFGDTADTARIVEIAARAAAAGLASTTDAINLTSAVTKAYGDTSAESVSKVADLALMAVNLGQTTFPELAASIGKITPLAAEMKVSQEELFGAMAAFTGVTGGAAEVATQLRGVMQSLMAPTDAMQGLFAKLGVESGKAAIEEFGLQKMMAMMVEAAEQARVPLQDYISSIEGQTIALAAAGGVKEKFTQGIAAMGTALGTSAVAFKEQTQGVNAAGFAFEQLKVKVTVALQQLGDELIPILVRAAEVMEPVFNWVLDLVKGFKDLPEPVKLTVVALGGIVAISAPTLMAIGVGFQAVAAGITAVGTASVAASAGFGKFAAFLLANPVVLALAGVGTAFAAAKIQMDDFRATQDAIAAQAAIRAKGFTEEAAGIQIATLAAKGFTLANVDLGITLGQLGESVNMAAPPIKKLTVLTEEQKKAAAELRAELEKAAGAYNGKQIAVDIKRLNDELAVGGGRAALWVEGFAAMADKAYALQQAGGTLTPQLKALVGSLELTKGKSTFFDFVQPRMDDLLNTLPEVTAAVDDFWNFVSVRNDNIEWLTPNMVLPGVRYTMDLATGEIIEAGEKAGHGFAAAFSETLSNLGPVIIGAIQGGGDVGGAIGASVGRDIGADLAKNILGESTSKLAKGALSFLGPLGALAGGAIGSMIGGLFSTAGRDDVKKWVAEQYGTFDALREKMLSLPDGGEALWINLTQKVGKGNTAQAAAAIKAIEEAFRAAGLAAEDAKAKAEAAFAASPEGLASGFPTRAQLQQAATEAEAAYTYMRESGLYTADVLAQAWDRWQDALIESGDAGTAALRKIDDEMKSIRENANFMAEQAAPEYDAEGNRQYGVEEQRQLDRLAALEAEKAAALVSIAEQVTAKELAADAADRSAQDAYIHAVTQAKDLDAYLRDLFSKGYEIPIGFGATAAGAAGGGGGTARPSRAYAHLPGFAEGTGGRYLDFGAGTPVMLHGRERVVTEAEGRGGNTINLVIKDNVVRSDQDIDDLTDKVIQSLNERGL